MKAAERMAGLYAMSPFGFFAVNVNTVNLDDLLDSCPGKVVRVFGRPGDEIRFFPAEDSGTLGCVAGWISDGDDS